MNSEYIQIQREVSRFCTLPDNLDAVVWRYLEYSKFESLIKDSALYLTRIDWLQDQFEGTYSSEQIQSQDEWLRDKGVGRLCKAEKDDRIRRRKCTFVSCWCVSDIDLDLMWKAYVPSQPGIAVKSTVRRLQRACDNAIDMWPIDISLVKYIDHASGQDIGYPAIPEVYFTKDHHFKLDNELRIVCWQSIAPPPEFRRLPVNLSDLIVSIAISPSCPTTHLSSVDKLLKLNNLYTVPIEHSRQDRPREE